MTTSQLPRYQQIVEDLLDRIERGDLAPGTGLRQNGPFPRSSE